MVALVVAIPLGVAAALIALGALIKVSRRMLDTLALATGIVVTGLCAVAFVRSTESTILVWFGNWRPRHGIVIGIPFWVDPFAAGAAGIAAVLVTMTLWFTWRRFTTSGALFHALMLVFLAAMTGFSFAADLFNVFVFFELMSITAYALTGFHIEETSPLQGALNFAITNSVGALVMLVGIALLYGRTGTLNLAAAGRALNGHPVDGLVVAAFTLLSVGLFVKAAVVPFHFWLADAHTVAPTPVCALFSAIMIELAVAMFARVYWTVFSGVLRPDIEHLRVVLVIAGTLTALVGATMCFVQYHLKRLLAFSAVAHGGLMVAGVGLLGPIALAGVAVYVLGHACVKAALFLATGLLRARCGTLNEMELHGRGRERALRVAAVVFVLGALGLAGVPPFGTFAGKSLLEDGARHAGMSWLVPVVVVVSAVTAGALLRATGRVFLGWGSRQAAATAITAPEGLYAGDEVTEEPEVRASGRRLPVSMWAPAVALVAAGFLVGLVPGITTGAEHAAARVVDQPAYEARVLRGRDLPVRAPAASSYPTAGAVGTSGAALAGAIVLAGLALGLERVPDRFRRAGRSLVPPVRALRLLQSGHAGDYVAFVIAGTAVFGSAVALAVR